LLLCDSDALRCYFPSIEARRRDSHDDSAGSRAEFLNAGASLAHRFTPVSCRSHRRSIDEWKRLNETT
jgi:hypothetical protein